MPGKVALLHFDKCKPAECAKKGGCAAVKVCKHKLIKQESPDEMPMFHPSTCQGCNDCGRACPESAIEIVRT